MNIKQVLENAIRILKKNNIDEPILKAKILLANILEQSKEYLIIHDTEELDENLVKEYNHGIGALCRGIPLQYITKKQEFMGLKFYVDENVLIPQPDTEILVEEVINICRNTIYSNKHQIKILDLCTGSGAIGISIAKNIENAKIILTDISKEALKVTKRNCLDQKCNLKIIESDLFENIEKEKFDIVVSNPPYIKTDIIKTLNKQVQQEPKIALDGGKDGLSIYRKIIEQAHNYLKDDGYLCLEIGYDQKKEVANLIKKNNNYTNMYSKKDFAGNDRIIVCQRI